jgi:hypothetical protein
MNLNWILPWKASSRGLIVAILGTYEVSIGFPEEGEWKKKKNKRLNALTKIRVRKKKTQLYHDRLVPKDLW